MKKAICFFLCLTTFAIRELAAESAADLLAQPNELIVIGENFHEITARMSDLTELARRLFITGSVSLRILDYDGRARSLPVFSGPVYPSFADDADPMFNYRADAGGTEIRAARETDYAVIFGPGDARAAFLNGVRRGDPENKMLKHLDSARSAAELAVAMDRSMFFNPLVLNDGLHGMMARMNFDDMDEPGFRARAKYGADSSNSGGDFGFSYSGDGLSVSAGFYAGSASEDDKYGKGAAAVYGANASARYGRIGFGAKLYAADWKNVAVMTPGGGVKEEAKSRLFYSFLDFGPKFGFFQPVIRLNYIHSEIGNRACDGLYLSYGARAYFYSENMGIGNKYGLYAARDYYGFDFGLSADWRVINDGVAAGVRIGPGNFSVEIRAGF
jgi:hypothetical protein